MLVIGDDYAADNLIVAGKILGGAVHHDIGTELQRPKEDWCRKCGIHTQQDIVLARDLDHFFKVTHLQQRIGWGLNPEHSCLGGDDAPYSIRICGIHVTNINTLLYSDVIQQARHSAINIITTDNMIPGSQELEARIHR